MSNVGGSASRKLVHVKFAQQYRSGVLQAPYNFRVFGRYAICEDRTRRRCENPGCVYIVFERNGNLAADPDLLSAPDRLR